mgnify:CR=1 FL=1|jgi:hypothetical protein
MMSLFLSQSELIELTERKRKAAQIAWLIANQFPFSIGANGHARVSREYVLARLGGAHLNASRSRPEPNWGAI